MLFARFVLADALIRSVGKICFIVVIGRFSVVGLGKRDSIITVYIYIYFFRYKILKLISKTKRRQFFIRAVSFDCRVVQL